jgi:LemA protein
LHVQAAADNFKFSLQEGQMGSGTVVLLVILAVIVFGFLFVVSIYNRLIQLKNRFKNAFAQIDVQLKRRYDLIPNLVETAKGYMKHEREALEAVIKARNQASTAMEKAATDPGNTEAIQGLIGAENALTGTLGRLFALAEAYPDLKANQNMMQLSEELTTTENKVSFARQAFNDAVMAYNTAREVFPNNIFANMFAFKEAQLFEINVESEREAPKVSF